MAVKGMTVTPSFVVKATDDEYIDSAPLKFFRRWGKSKFTGKLGSINSLWDFEWLRGYFGKWYKGFVSR